MDDNKEQSQKQQENQAAEKAGSLAGRAALDYATGGKSEQLRNMPVVGKQLKKAEDKAGKKIGKLDKKTGGNLGKVAKKADDAGVLDAADKGLSMLGGSKGEAKNTGSSGQVPNAPTSSNNAVNPANSPKHNFAKEGLPGNDAGVEPGKSDGATAKNFRDIQSRRADSDNVDSRSPKNKKSIFNNSDNSDKEQKVFISVEIDSLAKKTLIPVLVFLVIIVLFTALGDTFNNDNDLAAVDEEASESDQLGGSTNYYSNSDPKLKAFYDRVLETKETYSKSGKSINAMYITATYHILQEYNAGVSAKNMDQNMINTLADGMLGDSTVYSEDTYRKFLKEKFFPNYISEDKVDKAVDRVFEYIERYMDRVHPDSGCTTTTGSNCTYSINGIRGVTDNKINLSNIQVRLMDSSFCNGTDGKPVEGENLIDFEKYVLGVAYGEIGTGFKSEAEKVQLIAARSFALARPYSMNGAGGVKYVTENGNNILQIRSCVADQVFCNTDLGCSKNGSSQYYVMHSGTSYPVVYKDRLDNYPNSTLKSSWEATTGMVALDSSGKLVQLGYLSGKQNEWNNLASSGLDYVQIILQTYPEVREVKKMSCSDTTEKSDTAFLQVASRIWSKIANGGYKYYMDGLSVPPPEGLVDCSTFVSWVLYEYGFKDEFGGAQHSTVSFLNTDWSSKMGWTEISVAAGEDVSSKLQPGDILVRDTGAGGANGHINIIAEVKSDGTVLAYDCGSESNWNNETAKAGKPVDRTSFARTDSRAGKIIRVSNVSGDNCQTAESGEAIGWKQYDDKWKSIPLGNSSANIGGYGCFVTSIAIQIARSGVNTTLSDFNPGTFVKELNKYGSFDGSGNFNGGANIPKIAPGFSEKYNGVRLSGNAQNKISQIKGYLDQGLYPIMRVKTTNGQHWVAVIGVTDNDVIMADPGSTSTMAFAKYSVGECSTLNVYQIG